MHQECLARAHNNKEFGLGWPNRGARHASSLQQRRLLHRLERGKIIHVRRRCQNRDKHRVVAQANRPHKPPTASHDTIEGSRNLTSGLPAFKLKRVDQVCEACQLGKQDRLPFPKESSSSKGLLDVIHSDVWEPAQTSTIDGCRYYVLSSTTTCATRGSSR